MAASFKHIFVVETEFKLNSDSIERVVADVQTIFERDAFEGGQIIIASHSNQPADDMLVIPNATLMGEIRVLDSK